MPVGFDQEQGQLYQRVYVLSGGMNSAFPKPTVPETEATNMSGCLTSLGHIVPGFVANTEKWTVSEVVRYMFKYYGATEKLVLLGNTKCWVYSATTPTEKTPTPAFTSQTYQMWKGKTLISASAPVAVINNYGFDKPHYYDGGAGAFLILTNAPAMRNFCGWGGRMLGANVFDVSWLVNRLQWSKLNDVTIWSVGADISCGSLDLFDESDAIQNIEVTTGNIVIIFRRNSIYLGLPNSDVTNPMQSQYLSSYGILAPFSLQRAGNTFFYLGDGDVYTIVGYEEPTSIGFKIRETLFATYDPATIQYAWSFLDKVNHLYYLVLRQLDTTWKAWIYNYEQQSWSYQDLSGIYSIGEWYA